MIEQIAEKALYASRWLLAPIYRGLSCALLVRDTRETDLALITMNDEH